MNFWEWIILILLSAFGLATVIALVAYVAGAMRTSVTASSPANRNPHAHVKVRKRRRK